MFTLALPTAVWQLSKYALMIGEHTVTLVSWKSGSFTKLSEFVNDNQGISDFVEYLKKNRKQFNGKSIAVVISVVGEDYRFEKVAHLLGKYRSDMIKRKFQQLFRGATFQTVLPQGREAVGRRQDFFLFAGVLSNEKVVPWVRDLNRAGFILSGVHLGSVLTSTLLPLLIEDKSGVVVISICSKNGTIRHNFHIDGHLRFSRQSRFNETAQVETIYQMMRTEIEKTCSYLSSLKLMQPTSKIHSFIIAPEDLVEPINQMSQRHGQDRYNISAMDARQLGQKTGIKKPIEEYGRDSSIVLNELFRGIRFNQLAPFNQIRFHTLKMVSTAVSLVVLVWGLFNFTGIGFNALTAYGDFVDQNTELRVSISRLRENYENQVEGFGVPPSTPVNMRSAVNVLDNVTGGTSGSGPGKMMLYLSKLITRYPAIQIDNFHWYISNSAETPTGELSFANGQQVYEVFELEGIIQSLGDAKEAHFQYIEFIEEIQARADMLVIEKVAPSLVEADTELAVTIEGQNNIANELNRFQSDRILLAVAWQPNFLDNLEEGGEQN